jgi:sec-independent protein translocase protein TatA
MERRMSRGSIGMPELIIILVIALIIFGPRKLPDLGSSLGKAIRDFKRAIHEPDEKKGDDRGTRKEG